MDKNRMIVPQPGLRFEEIVTRILQSQGFRSLSGTEADLLMQKDNHTYQAEIKYSRSRVFPTASVAPICIRLEALAQTDSLIPLVVVGGEVSPSLMEELRVANHRTEVVDIRNLLYMAATKRELYDELVSVLPYSISGLTPTPPSFLTASTLPLPPSGSSKKRGTDFPTLDLPGGNMLPVVSHEPIMPIKQKGSDSGELCRELTQWQGGRGTALSIQYEKLCTRVLKHLFSTDLALWQEQAKSNDGLYRFDLICKIRRDNHKDFWEMAEHHFHSKYIIFEFKNYSGEVTQMEVTTTARYLYTKALRSIAIIISPNGFSDHAEKAARGALREDGKLILALTNAELVEMLQMQDNGDDPADYLSDKLDALLIDLEK